MLHSEITAGNRNSYVIWQDDPDSGVGEPALLIETYNGSFSIRQGAESINVNYSTVKELCRIMKELKEPE